MKKSWMFKTAAGSLVALAACGGGGGGSDTPEPVADVSFSQQVQPIFDSRCISCHASGGQASFLLLTSGASYAALVGQPSTYSAGKTLVISGDSSNSVLYLRVSGTTEGSRMPQGMSPLTAADQDIIKVWIDEGAQNN